MTTPPMDALYRVTTCSISDESLGGSLHLAGQVERPNPKLLLRGEDRSPLKFIMNVLL